MAQLRAWAKEHPELAKALGVAGVVGVVGVATGSRLAVEKLIRILWLRHLKSNLSKCDGKRRSGQEDCKCDGYKSEGPAHTRYFGSSSTSSPAQCQEQIELKVSDIV